jgi:sugar/nucleoside kinase (ribokinase family)
MSVLVAGTVGIDNIRTADGVHRDGLLGGSATYAAIAASFSSQVHLVAVVGDDFPTAHLERFAARGISTAGLQTVPGGKTFRWTGEYHEDMNSRETLETHINVLTEFAPALGGSQREPAVTVLANMAPADQLKVLAQIDRTGFVVADSMDLWINIARDDLLEVLRRVDLFVVNDSEARMFTDEPNLVTAGRRILEHGPSVVVVKKGEHGALVFGRGGKFHSAAAYPVERLVDPTGAGDAFLGGLAGALAQQQREGGGSGFAEVCRAVAHGTVLASFNCESFSTDRLSALSAEEVAARAAELRSFSVL